MPTRRVVEFDKILFVRVDTIVQAINSVSEVTSLCGVGGNCGKKYFLANSSGIAEGETPQEKRALRTNVRREFFPAKSR